MRPSRVLLVVVVALLAGAAAAVAATPPASVRVHAIFGGTGTHVGQVLDVRPRGTHAAVKQICWSPAPIDRPACSASPDGAPSATGTTQLTVELKDGRTLTTSLHVTPGYAHRGGHRGSDAAEGHVTCRALRLTGNVPRRGHRVPASDRIATLTAGTRVAQYNRIGDYVAYWVYGTDRIGFGHVGCVADGAS